MKKLFIVIFLSLFTFSNLFPQTAKKFYSSAEKFQKANNYPDAVINYTKCIELEPNNSKAYINRAVCFEQIAKKSEAAEDYKRAAAFQPKEKELFYNAGRLFFEVQNYPSSDEMLKKAIELDNEYIDAINLRIKTLQILKNYQEALSIAELALKIKKSSVNYYNRAVANDSLKNYAAAEKDYKESKYYDSKFIPAYVGLAFVQLKTNKPDQAIATCDAALAKDPQNKDVFFTRSHVYAQKNDLQNAINDISKVTTVDPTNPLPFFIRSGYYQKLGQWQNSISDLNTCIKIDDKNNNYYLSRAHAYEQINNFSDAIKDYNQAISLGVNDRFTKQLLSSAKEKLFELNREKNKPEILISSHKIDGNKLSVAGNATDMVISGKIADENFIKSILVNNTVAEFKSDTINPSFSVKVNVYNAKEITFVTTDLYDNTQKITYSLHRTETDKPIVALTTPYTSFDNEIAIDNNNTDLYIEGKVKDESMIESIIVDGLAASFPLNTLNPTFSTKISIANKNKITITVKDIYGNEQVQDFTINRDGIIANQNNPMGNTWVVFIENSIYSSFPSLDGPAKDVTQMKAALANYKLTKIIHKKNMSKSELEKFFAIELRDLIKTNKVNSLLIWYAGHGKFVNQVGYWIPVDAQTDDEFTYFNINSLKAYMQSYTQLVHTLVVTDACESGPTFFTASRGDKERKCFNWEDSKFKSAQVFTSAGYELASDISQFTKTFAASLNNNPDDCISIDKIAEKVSNAVKQSGKQVPKLGRISGLDDTDGTFFFIKK